MAKVILLFAAVFSSIFAVSSSAVVPPATTTAEDNSTSSILCSNETTTPLPGINCDTGFSCANGQCINVSQLCDGNMDCDDSSDEGEGCQNRDTQIAVQVETIFRQYGCVDVLPLCVKELVTPLIIYGGPLTEEKLCTAFQGVYDCAVYRTCRGLSEEHRALISSLLQESFYDSIPARNCQLVPEGTTTTTVTDTTTTTASDTTPDTATASPTTNPASTITPPTSSTTTTATTTEQRPQPSSRCITSCRGLQSGDYQSCNGCSVYVSCVHGRLYDNRPCPGPLVWDDVDKQCMMFSTTCENVVNRPGRGPIGPISPNRNPRRRGPRSRRT